MARYGCRNNNNNNNNSSSSSSSSRPNRQLATGYNLVMLTVSLRRIHVRSVFV